MGAERAEALLADGVEAGRERTVPHTPRATPGDNGGGLKGEGGEGDGVPNEAV